MFYANDDPYGFHAMGTYNLCGTFLATGGSLRFTPYLDHRTLHSVEMPDISPVGSRFSPQIQEKAWGMVKEFMTNEQWNAYYVDSQTVELYNKLKTHRLLIDKGGNFRLLKGNVGEGITVTSGRIYESKYPLGDEIASIIALFRYDTQKMIENWRCGNFTSKNSGDLVELDDWDNTPPFLQSLEHITEELKKDKISTLLDWIKEKLK